MLNLKIINEKHRKLLDRKELVIEAIYEGSTPKKNDLLKEISSLTKAKENLVVIKTVNQLYGAPRAKILAYVYNSEEALKNIEPKIKKKEDKAQKQPAKQENKESS